MIQTDFISEFSTYFSISCECAAVWDYDTGMQSDFIGFVEISLQELALKNEKNELIALTPPPKPHNQEAGSLRVLDIGHFDPATKTGKVKNQFTTH